MEKFKVQLGHFEGPLDLLLDLIERRKLHINDIALSQVTDDFISYTKNLPGYHMGNSAHFILVASTLLLIKSKSLLPGLSLTTEETADIKDLEERLRKLQRVREASVAIKTLFGKEMIFSKEEQKVVEPLFSPEETITKLNILTAIHTVIASIPLKEYIPKAIVKKVISIEEMINQLIKRVQSSLKMSFRQFTGEKAEKVTLIVGFLAMLELVKQGIIAVTQEEDFGDIAIEHTEIGVPRIL